MKILFVLENYIPHIGGVETVFRNLMEGLARKGHDVSLVTHRLKGTQGYEAINGVKVYRVNCFHSRYWFSFLAIPKVLKLARNVDIVHTTTYNGALPARIAARLLGKPSIITVHEILGKNWLNFDMGFLSAKIHQFLEYLITRLKFDEFVCVSNSTRKNLLRNKIKKEKAVVVYNGIDYVFFNPKKYSKKLIRKKLGLEKNFIYMFYGRPGVTKGVEYLIKAVPLISNQIENSKLLLILSKSPLKNYNKIINLIKKLKIEKNIKLLEPQKWKDMPKYIAAADCIVVPSLTEGFGFTAAEAAAMNVPVVASNTTSLPEVVSGRHVLVEPKSPTAIADGVFRVYEKKDNYKKPKKFAIKDNIEGYLKIYKRLKGQ